ncbi:hypothetical protein [Thermococcus sp.]
MSIKDDKTRGFKGWNVDPFTELQKAWKAINEGALLGVPHIVGRIYLKNGVVSKLDMNVILHEKEKELSFMEGDMIYFVIPVRPEDGIEGLYMKLDKVLRDAI